MAREVMDVSGRVLDIGVVGAGTMARVHIEAFCRMDGVRVVGIVARRSEENEALARQTGARLFGDLDELLEATGASVIDVCSPTFTHRSYVEAAAFAGRHVICEKPLARTLADARAMVRVCEAAGVHLLVAHVLRFFPDYKLARDIVQSGGLGSVSLAKARRVTSFPETKGGWYRQRDKSGTVMVDLLIHDIDFLLWCFGDVARVYAQDLGYGVAGLEHASISLSFATGVVAHVEGTWGHPAGFRTELEIVGNDRTLHIDSAAAAPLRTASRSGTQGGQGVAVPENPLRTDPYQAQLTHFVACLRGVDTPRITALEACRALEVSLAALESAETGRAFELHHGSTSAAREGNVR